MARPRKTAESGTAITGKAAGPANSLMQAAAALDKVFKGKSPEVMLDLDSLKRSRPHIPSESIVIDYLIGGRPNKMGVAPCPGWPRGAVCQLWGHESSGKTTLALHACAGAIRRGGTVAFIDFENALDYAYAQALGVPVSDKDKFKAYQPDTLEDGLSVLFAMAKMGVDVIVVDSVGAGVPKRVFEQSVEEQGGMGRVGEVAALWSVFLPKLTKICAKSGSTVIGLSQLRNKISTGGPPGASAMGDGKQPQGGEAWKFYSSVRMKLQKTFSEKTKIYSALDNATEEQVTTVKIKAKMEKSKVSASQQHEADIYITFGQGVDDFRSVLEICTAHGAVKKSGSWLSWVTPDGEEIRVQGISKLRDAIEEAGASDALWAFARSKLVTGIVESPEEGGDDLTGLLDDDDDGISVNPAFTEDSE